MSVTEKDVVDGIAIDHDDKTLIMEIYDHLDFEGNFEFVHIDILQKRRVISMKENTVCLRRVSAL